MRINNKYITKRTRSNVGYEPAIFEKGYLRWGDSRHSFINFIPDKLGEHEVIKGAEMFSSTLENDFQKIDIKEYE